jgi:Domain of unknown function (DUF5011)
MKKRYLFILIVFVCIISSCEKDPIISNDKNVGISRVAYYPSITLTGNTIIAFENGTAFTDPGVKATAGGTDVPIVTTGTVNTAVNGVYTLTYTATNTDGSSTATRTVVVYSTDDDAASHDLSGKYLRASTGQIATWTKIAPGVYSVQNPGGSPAGPGLIVVAINPTAYDISIPDQIANDGSESSSSDETYTPSSPATYSWKFLNPLYGTALRTFVKQ